MGCGILQPLPLWPFGTVEHPWFKQYLVINRSGSINHGPQPITASELGLSIPSWTRIHHGMDFDVIPLWIMSECETYEVWTVSVSRLQWIIHSICMWIMPRSSRFWKAPVIALLYYPHLHGRIYFDSKTRWYSDVTRRYRRYHGNDHVPCHIVRTWRYRYDGHVAYHGMLKGLSLSFLFIVKQRVFYLFFIDFLIIVYN